MTPVLRGRLLLAGAIAIAAIAVACDKEAPTSPSAQNGSADENGIDRSSIVAVLSCHGDVRKLTVSCASPTSGPNRSASKDDAANILIGGQDQFVAVKSGPAAYNAGTSTFTFDVTVRNLIPQPMGTKDTTGANAPDPNGVRVFFSAGPTVTSGTGLVSVVPDGFATFTGVNQPYYQYSTVLPQFAITSPKTWTLSVPPTVLTFDFLLLVSTEVPRPNGYIDLVVGPITPPTDRQMTYTVRNANGTIVGSPEPLTWAVSDTTRATVDNAGLINPLRTGFVTVIAESGGRIGKLTVFIKPITRTWTGAADVNYANGANWLPDSVKPEPTDSILVNDSPTLYPTLTANESVATINVLDVTPGGTIPMISLGAFTLNSSGDVHTTNSASISSTTGSLVLSGAGRTVGGTLTFLDVTGTYTMDADVITRAPLKVRLGRLTNPSLLLRAVSN
jgi:hypothetical protein